MNAGSRGRAAWAGLLLALLLLTGGCTQSNAAAYQRAVALFAEGEYQDAALAFQRLGEYQQAETYYNYSQGLVLYEQGDYAQAEPYFEKTQSFMYGKNRYQYCRAYVLESQGLYAEAADVYLGLGEFENAYQAGHYCLSRIAAQNNDYATALHAYELAGDYGDAAIRLEELQFLVYEQANKLKLRGTWLINQTAAIAETPQDTSFSGHEEQAAGEAPAETPDPHSLLGEAFMAQAQGMTDGEKTSLAIELFEQSLHYYTLLGSYYNSAADAARVKETMREQQYRSAEALVAQGSTQEAYEAFLGLSGYSDAETRAEELAAQLGIPAEDEE